MSLNDPTSKMGKSEDPKGTIALLDPPSVIAKKVRSAVTDSGREVRYDEIEKPAISNLMVIYSLCAGESFETIEERYRSKGYGDFKNALADQVVATLEPIQQRFKELSEPGVIEEVLESGRARAETLAQRTLDKFRKKLGLVPRVKRS